VRPGLPQWAFSLADPTDADADHLEADGSTDHGGAGAYPDRRPHTHPHTCADDRAHSHRHGHGHGHGDHHDHGHAHTDSHTYPHTYAHGHRVAFGDGYLRRLHR
jgi:hypothetical protein